MPLASEEPSCEVVVFGASVRGRAHRRTGVPNQDAWTRWRNSQGVGAAVCDGLGSRPHSQQGAQAGGRAVRDALRPWLRADGASTDALVRLTHLFWGLRISPRTPADCATTCLFAHVRPDGRLLFGGIGDGLVLVRHPDGWVQGEEDTPRDFSNETPALGVSKSVADWRIREVHFPPGSIAILATDGVSEDLVPERKGDFARYLIQRLEPVKPSTRSTALRGLLRQWPTKGHIDDLTLAVLWRPNHDLT
jgi:serine/threonine protein phosphatase PrpC